ncbi:17565_t:CDS:1, partial [Dentiscutata erythropus]
IFVNLTEMTSVRRKKYISGRACENCKKKKHKCDNEGIQCKYCAKRNLMCVRVKWDKRGRKPNKTAFQTNVISPIHINKESSNSSTYEQPQPESNECILYNYERQLLYPDLPIMLHEPTYDINDLDLFCLFHFWGNFYA